MEKWSPSQNSDSGVRRGKDDRKQNTLTPLCVLDEIVGSNAITKYKMAASNLQEEVFPYLAPSLFPLLAIFLTGTDSGSLVLKTAVTRNVGASFAIAIERLYSTGE
jgi:hypothetical protein